ncbi:MAG: hypothetical protein JWM44_476 [Bacilli bacterium]|nr:hypothetical protein [Bacilli bacterium]
MGILKIRLLQLFIIFSLLLMLSFLMSSNNKAYAAGTSTAISGGNGFSLSLAADGTVWSWGTNSEGQLGDGTTSPRLTPVEVSGLSGKTITSISSRYLHSLAAASDGTVWSWGDNSFGQIGNNALVDQYIPIKVSGLLIGKTITTVSSGKYHSLALASNGTVWSWGDNTYGQLGNGSTVSQKTPVQVSGLSGKTITAIAAGDTYSLALANDGTVWTWGNNSSGQLGDGTTIQKTSPVNVSTLMGTTITAIAAGSNHSIALDTNFQVWTWGNNNSGQLGDGATTNRSVPFNLSSMASLTITAIAAENEHSLALVSDGTVRAWGENDLGQLGDTSTTQRLAPVTVVVLAGKIISSIASGTQHALALGTDGNIWSWGNNTNGELGDGTIISTSTSSAILSLADQYESVSIDKANLAITYGSGDHATSITQDIILPASGTNGTTITWGSSDPTVLSDSGVVNRQASGDTNVSMTATITKGSLSDILPFALTIKQTDAGAVASTKTVLAIVYTSGDSGISVTKNLTLPLVGSNGATISWGSSDPSVVSNSGVVNRPLSVDASITLTATISKNGANDTDGFALTVIAQSDAAAVNEAKTALQIGYASGDTNTNVTNNLTLPLTGLNGTVISWVSSNLAVLSDSGIVTQPTSGNINVTLTATIAKNATTSTQDFILTLPQTAAGAVASTKASLVIGYTGGDIASTVTQNLVLTSSGVNGATITWFSNNSAVLSNSGVVTRPANADVALALTATIRKGGVSDTLAFPLTVIQSDVGAVAMSKTALAVGYSTGENSTKVTKDVTLATTGTNGTTISWASSNTTVLSNSGIVARDDNADTTITLTATFTKNAAIDTKVFTFKVLQTDSGSVTVAKASLTVGYSSGDSISAVTKTLTLALSGASGTTVSWVSSDPTVITNAGVVSRKADGDKNITLTATIRKNTTSDPLNVTSDTVAFSLTVLQSDAGAISVAKAALAIVYASGDSATNVTQNLTLAASGTNGTSVTWTSSNLTVINNAGVVTRQTTGDIKLTLTATIKKNSTTDRALFTLTVPQMDLSAVAAAKKALVLGYAKGDKVTSVTKDVYLAVNGTNGTTISWASDKPPINTSGVVNRPADANTLVTLTATISKNGVTDTKAFPVLVVQTDLGAVATEKAAITVVYASGDSSTTVTKKLTLATVGANGTTVVWSSSNALVVNKSGSVMRQAGGDMNVTLTATIKKNAVSDTATFNLTVLQSDLGAIKADQLTLALGYTGGDSAANVTQNLTLSGAGLNGTTVTWATNNATVISNTGVVTRLANKDSKVTLTAIIKKNTSTIRKTFALIVPQTDVGVTTAAKTALSIGYATADKSTNVTKDLRLATTGTNGTIITWASSNTAVISNSGAVTRQASGDQSITLTATITKNSSTDTAVFTVTVPQIDADAVAAAKAALTIGYTNGETSASVTKDLILNRNGLNGTLITWTSSSAAISNSGKVIRQANGDTSVTLIATIKKNQSTDTLLFTLNVPQSDAGAVAAAKAALIVGYASGDSATYVTHDVTLASSDSNGAVITWSSNQPTVVSNSGVITPTAGKKTAVNLTATITKNSVTTTKVFSMSV